MSYPITISDQAVVAHGDAIYSFGGYIGNGYGPSAAAYQYLPATNTWAASAHVPTRYPAFYCAPLTLAALAAPQARA